MVHTTLFIDLEAIAGPGPDKKLGSLSRVNADAETLGGQDEKLTVREGWLWLQFVNDRLDFFIGKLDLTNYFDRNAFANDETTPVLERGIGEQSHAQAAPEWCRGGVAVGRRPRSRVQPWGANHPRFGWRIS